jgi:hypothetical protein
LAQAEAVRETLFRARRYYNRLVEIEVARRARFDAIRKDISPELAQLEVEWEEADASAERLVAANKRQRQRHWQVTDGDKRRLLDGDFAAELARLHAERRSISAAAKPLRAEFSAMIGPANEERKRRSIERAAGGGPLIRSAANADVLDEMMAEDWPDAWKRIARSDDMAKLQHINARSECGLATGTYLAVEDAFARAKKDSAPTPPRFKRFDGTGKLQVQLLDETFADLMSGSCSKCAMREGTKDDPEKKGRPPMAVTMAQWIPRGPRDVVRMTVRHDRLPPADAKVKWASLVVRRSGARLEYEFQLTLEHASFGVAKRPAGTRPSEHVRVGWSRVDGGVRVAQWPSGGVVLPDSILRQHDHAASIVSAADAHYDRVLRLLRRLTAMGGNKLSAWHRMGSDRARDQVRRWCVAYADWALGADVVKLLWREWVRERRAHGSDLYAPACVARRWLRGKGVDESTHAAWILYTWARKDAHLCQYAADSSRRFARRRDEYYRVAAVRLATEFEAVTVDKYNIASLRELPALTMPGDPPRDQAQHNAHAAAPGRFREILAEVMGPRCTPCERPGDARSGGGARKTKPSDTKRVLAAAASATSHSMPADG